MLSWELSLLDWIQANLRSPLGDALMVAISALGNGGVLWLCLGVLLLFPKQSRKLGGAVLLSLGLEILCCNFLLKPLVSRPRPCDVNRAVQLLIPRPEDFSFPSGHTGASFAAASGLFFSRSRLWIPALVLVLLIAFSRLYLYVHYPTDVLAGAALGIVTGWLGAWASARAGNRT